MTDETPLSEYTSVTRKWGRLSVRVFPDYLEIGTRNSRGNAKGILSYDRLSTDRTEGEFYERDFAFAWPAAFACAFLAGGAILLAGSEPPLAILISAIAFALGFASARRKTVYWVHFPRQMPDSYGTNATLVGRPMQHGRDPEFEQLVADITSRIRNANQVSAAPKGNL
jgi:hypothetical protein